MWLEQRRQALLQLHPGDQQVCLLPTKVRLILEVLHKSIIANTMIDCCLIRIRPKNHPM